MSTIYTFKNFYAGLIDWLKEENKQTLSEVAVTLIQEKKSPSHLLYSILISLTGLVILSAVMLSLAPKVSHLSRNTDLTVITELIAITCVGVTAFILLKFLYTKAWRMLSFIKEICERGARLNQQS